MKPESQLRILANRLFLSMEQLFSKCENNEACIWRKFSQVFQALIRVCPFQNGMRNGWNFIRFGILKQPR